MHFQSEGSMHYIDSIPLSQAFSWKHSGSFLHILFLAESDKGIPLHHSACGK